MVQVISNLGGTSAQFSATSVLRPVFVSLGFGLIVPLTARWIVLPVTSWIYDQRSKNPSGGLNKWLSYKATAPTIHAAIFFGLTTAAGYAGTSNLFAAYLAGASISWWDSEVGHQLSERQLSERRADDRASDDRDTSSVRDAGVTRAAAESSMCVTTSGLKGADVFEQYCSPLLERILKPFFFVGADCLHRLCDPANKFAGLYWLLYSDHSHVLRDCTVEGNCLHSPDVSC